MCDCMIAVALRLWDMTLIEGRIMKSNEHKKDFKEDKFARHYYCQHARLTQLREDKKQGKRKTRRKNKKLTFTEGAD
mgnify:CR=1 FL=1